MKKLSIERPRHLENLFKELEDNILYVIHYSESEFYEFDIKVNHIEYLTENKSIENNFHSIVDNLKLHLLEQLKNKNTTELLSFFQKQEIYFNMFLPDKRKKEIHNVYLIQNIASGDEGILTSSYNLSEYQSKFIRLIFEKYVIAYNQLYSELSNLKSQFISTQISVEKTEQDTPTFENNFDNVNPAEIYKHFKNGLVDKEYLSVQELNEYLKAAFEFKTTPEILFKLKHTPTKQNIYTVFYTYYKDVAQKKHNTQEQYAALLGDYFEGYKTKIIQTNWARDYKAKR